MKREDLLKGMMALAMTLAMTACGNDKSNSEPVAPVTSIIPLGREINFFIFSKLFGKKPKLSKPPVDIE